MNISVIGTGYVGLVTGTCLAEVGNHVCCVDNDASKIDSLNNGELPIYEPGLDDLVERNVAAGRLEFSTDLATAVNSAKILIVAVGTPADEDGSADLSHVLSVASEIGDQIREYKLILTKSTVPVGTASRVKQAIDERLAERGVEVSFDVASNPEFLKEGAAIDDFMKPDRIVVGADDEQAIELLRTLYAPFNRNHDRLIIMDIPSAELTKYAANAMLATKISFMNELSGVAERLGADIELVRQGIGSDPRIGYHFIYAGAGYGGSCFPKDVQALYKTARESGYEARILDAVEAVNRDQKEVLLNKIDSHFDGDVSGKRFALWGLAFKPNTDDMREAPSRVIMEGLWQRGARVSAFDPVAMPEARRVYGDRDDFALVDDAYEALRDADALVVVTEWQSFRSPDMGQMKSLMQGHVIFDGRNIFNPDRFREDGFDYYGIGR